MKQTVIAATLLALTFSGTAQAMSTVTVPSMPTTGNTFNPTPPGPAYGIMREPTSPDSVPNPYVNQALPYMTTGNAYLYGETGKNTGRFLNIDPFDPNSVQNNFDRGQFANPFQYDPIYNPFGQGASPYAPGGGARVQPGRGMPYGR